MKSRFIPDPQDPSGDGVLNTAGDGVDPNFFPSSLLLAAGHAGSPSFNAHPAISAPLTPVEAVEAQVAFSSSTGPSSVVSETSGGIAFNLNFDAAAMASTTAAANFRAGIEQAASILSATITDKITVNLNIDYSGTGGGAAAGPDNGLFENYSTIRADLANNATKGDPTFNALPTGSSFQGQSQIAVWNSQLKLYGQISPTDATTDDGTATFATDINSSLLVGVALHELTHALGRVPYGPPFGPQPDIFDLFRFTSAGTQLINGDSTAPAAYFSVDGGFTKIADYGQTSDPSDFLNSGVQGGNDPFNEFYTPSTLQSLTTADKEQLDALGFHLASPLTTTIQTDTNSTASTSLVQFFGNYYLENASTGVGPELKYGGVPVVAGQFAPYTPIGAAQTATGYEVALENASANSFSIWNTDSNGNFLTFTVYPGNNTALESVETSFNQDLNGDGVIGIPVPVVISAHGSTELVEDGNNYFLDSISSGTGPELKYNGTPVVAGQFAPYVQVGVFQTASGYEVAFEDAAANLFSIWNTDSNGNFQSFAVYSGNSPLLESLETNFQQDLNGDGVVGIPTSVTKTVISSFGATSLVEIGNNYFLDSTSSGTGPFLKYDAAAVAVGQFAPYVPVGVFQTATGYEVALENASANSFSIWNTDSNGNFLSYAVYSGNSTALESLETSFHQDLNGDGTTGVVTKVISAFGSTELVEVGNNYFLDSISSGTGPELKFNGSPVTAGQFAPYVPVGVFQTASAYEVALENASANSFSIWNTDSNGNFLSYAVYSGNSTALESLETSFHQDLNGDGTIGVVTKVISAFGSTELVEAGNNYFLDNISSGTGPELQYNGAPVVAGQFTPYVPVGVEKTATGYEVAFENAAANLFSIWNTDSNGNFLSFNVYSGNSTALESLEPGFHQDLNGDGTIGIPAAANTAVISAFGSTGLVEVGNNDFLESNLSGTGPELKYNGAPVAAGQFAPYVPVGVFQTASGGYEVAFENAAANLFSIWNTDSNANFQSFAVYSGTSTALESLETNFHQDLNGDGVIGIPASQQAAVVPLASTSQAAPVLVTSNDTFVFRPDLGAGAVANTEDGSSGGFGRSSPAIDLHIMALAQNSQSSLTSAHVGYSSPADLVNHDQMHWTTGDVHTHGFLIG